VSDFQNILDRFCARKSGDGWTAKCPAHDDKNPSLAISVNERDGKILVYCHAGCTTEAVCAAAGIELTELFTDNGPAQRVVAEYGYSDEKGALLYQVLRFDPKDFRQRRPEGNGWSWKLNGTRRVLYRLPELLKTKSVLIVEGEKDCETARQMGLVATCNSGGAGKWRDEYSESLRGKRITIIADSDEPGRKHAQQVATSLFGKVESLKVLELPGSKDLSDWAQAGGTKDALVGFIESQNGWDNTSWRGMFHSFADFENAPPLTFSIENFLQNDAATLIAGLSGHGKTCMMLSMVKALLAGPDTMLWDYFRVLERAERILYLIPESSIGPFKHRLKLFGVYDFLKDDRLLVRTLSMGPTPLLSDPRILAAAKGAHVFLDTIIRFQTEGDENSASDNQRGLAADIFALLEAQARTIVPAQHSPKSFINQSVMNLENCVRGSGDIGAMVATGWGLKQLDATQNVVHVENLKPRDFQPPGPFQIIGRPYIDESGDFRMHKPPNECSPLADEQDPRDKGGAPILVREHRAANMALLRGWLADAPGLTSPEIVKLFAQEGIEIAPGTVRRYKSELEK
jgi:AAA domain